MTVSEFAGKHGLRTRRDAESEEIIPGFHESGRMVAHIYFWGEKLLAICFMFPREEYRRWNGVLRRLPPLGFVVRQNGDSEGTLLFDPLNEAQAAAAIEECGALVASRPASPEERERLRQIGFKKKGSSASHEPEDAQ